MLTVARAVVEINARFRHADAPRFVVKDPEDKEYRRVKLSPDITTVLHQHIRTNRLGRDDLIFPMPTPEPDAELGAVDVDDAPLPDLATLGRTEPNMEGRTYQHGTVTAYNLGTCR